MTRLFSMMQIRLSTHADLFIETRPWCAIGKALAKRIWAMHCFRVWLAKTIQHQAVPVSWLLCLLSDKVCMHQRRAICSVRIFHRNYNKVAYIYICLYIFHSGSRAVLLWYSGLIFGVTASSLISMFPIIEYRQYM